METRTRYTTEDKKKYVALYQSGIPVKTLCIEYSLCKSSVYKWISDYSEVKTASGDYVSAKRLYELEKRLGRINRENEILRFSGCMPQSPLEQRIQAIIRLRKQYNMHVLCETLQVRRSTVYHRLNRAPEMTLLEKENEILCEQIQKIFKATKGRLGSKKICQMLRDAEFTVSPNRISALMKKMNLKVVSRVNRRKRPTIDNPIKENHLQQQFAQIAPNRAWVSDITYINVNNILYSICIIIDLFSRKVIAYTVSENNGVALIMETWEKAHSCRRIMPGLIFHSDQGVQYMSYDFKRLLKNCSVTPSLSRAGFPYDNAVVESFNACLKSEELNRYCYTSFGDLKKSVNEYIEFYNNTRPHQYLKYKTPQAVEDVYFKFHPAE